jgi:hypothetical protein
MKNLFDAVDNNGIIERINKLTPDTNAMWGKMTVAQMLAHSQTTIEVALGERKLKGGLIGFLFGKIAKKKLVKDEPFKKNLPTAPSFIIKNERNFYEEKNKLIKLIQRFGKTDPDNMRQVPIPFLESLRLVNGIHSSGNILITT